MKTNPNDPVGIEDTETEEECEVRCSGCGICLDDFSEYCQTEGYCDDCL